MLGSMNTRVSRSAFSPLARIALALAAILPLGLPATAEPRNLEFAGIVWGLRQTAGPAAPGPNIFSNAEDQAWLDEAGRLHLSLRKRGDIWTATELMAKKNSGYGAYRFKASNTLRDLDPNIVFGFFTWDTSPELFNRELDIEISRWGAGESLPGWFTVQPYDKPGNQSSFDLPPAQEYAFEMRWEPTTVSFAFFADGSLGKEWRFEGPVPDPGRARLRINLWLFRGKAPAGPGPYEVVLSDLRFEPLQ